MFRTCIGEAPRVSKLVSWFASGERSEAAGRRFPQQSQPAKVWIYPAAFGQLGEVVPDVILWADDTHAAYAKLVGAGAPALAGPHEGLGRLLIVWTADPGGHPIQIVQRGTR